MRLNGRVRRHEQQDRIKTRFGRVTEKHFGMDAGEARAFDLIAVNRPPRISAGSMRISGSDCAHRNDASDSPAKKFILIVSSPRLDESRDKPALRLCRRDANSNRREQQQHAAAPSGKAAPTGSGPWP